VGGATLVLLARGAAFALRLAGNLVRSLSRVVITLYDVVIVLPLLIERLVAKKQNGTVNEETLAVRRH
jgi:hypothetical protein